MNVADVVQDAYDKAKREGVETRIAAEAVIAALDTVALRMIAAEYVVDAIARAKRDYVHSVEVRASRKRAQRLASETESAHRDRDEIGQRHTAAMMGIIEKFASDLKMTWTQELLDAGIVLSDGRVTTWGDATIEDHRDRISIFERNASENARGAARHAAAIREIQAAGCTTLREMQSIKAA